MVVQWYATFECLHKEQTEVADAELTIGQKPIGHISPRLYGHFAEHLGRCCYGGLWEGVDGDPAVPNVSGFRADVIEALLDLPVPVLRWPGGCYADHYHWRNGIGAPQARPSTLGMSCGLRVSDDNGLGTHEFLRLCELIGAEPYLAGNVGTGSVQEFCDWVEYVTSSVDSGLTKERAANGRPDPWPVRLWGVGNESWDCGGRFDPVTYAHEFVRYATLARHVDPEAEFVGVGLEDEGLFEQGLDRDWNAKFLEALGPSIDLLSHLSIHRYWSHGGPETGFREDDYYALLAEAQETETTIERTARTIAAIAPTSHAIRVALDEWGVWHPEARPWGPGDVPRRTPVTYEQANTLRDALAAGIALEGFHRQCNVLSMANLAQIVNVLQAVVMTDGSSCFKTPTYHVLTMHRPHMGAEALGVAVASAMKLPSGEAAVSATASLAGGRTAVTIINRDYRRRANVSLEARAGAVAKARLLAADSADAVNTAAHPDRVAPRMVEVAMRPNGRYEVDLPAHSLATIEFAEG